MKYVCLVYQDEKKLEAMSDDELDAINEQCSEWIQELEKNGQCVLCSALQSRRTATTLRKGSGKLSVTDGPFAETKEFLAGFTIIEARDLNEAIHIASRFPVAIGCLEVRPAFDSSSNLSDQLDQRLAASIRRCRHKVGQL